MAADLPAAHLTGLKVVALISDQATVASLNPKSFPFRRYEAELAAVNEADEQYDRARKLPCAEATLDGFQVVVRQRCNLWGRTQPAYSFRELTRLSVTNGENVDCGRRKGNHHQHR